jgi:hypothetical protein
LHAFVYRVIGDTGRAEEIASEVFWRIHRKPPAASVNVHGWLCRTAIRLALDNLRSDSRRLRYQNLSPPGFASPNPEQSLQRLEECEQVRSVLAVLRPEFAEMLLLRADGCSYADIAEALQLNPIRWCAPLSSRDCISKGVRESIWKPIVAAPNWVANHLALLDPPPGWLPDAQAAYDRLRMAPPAGHGNASWRWAAAAAAVLIVALLALPGGRAAAQRLWELITLNRVEVIRTDPDDFPENVQDALRARITVSPGRPEPAATVAEASSRTGFDVRLPRANVLTGSPKLATLGPLEAELILKVDALRSAARTSGVDLPVPDEWNGARIAVNTGRSAVAAWPDDTSLMQARPFGMSVPSNVPLTAFTELAQS